jgi:ligand-binding sensor domain-containing protein
MRRLTLSLLLPGLVWAQSIVGEFSTLTSILNLKDLIVTPDKIFAASPGGLVEFDKHSQEFYAYSLEHGLAHPNLTCLVSDAFGRLWLGIGEPRGEINVWDIQKSTVVSIYGINTFGESLTAITAIAFAGTRAFAAYQRNVDWGVLEFRQQQGSYVYRDFYQNFAMQFSYINDLQIIRDTLWLATNVGLLFAEVHHPNLKDPTAWQIVNLGNANKVTNVIDVAGQIITTCGSYLFQVNGTKATFYDYGTREEINALFITNDATLGIATQSGVYLRSGSNSWVKIGSRSLNRVKCDGDVLWGGSTEAGLWCYVNGKEVNYIPNTPIDNVFTALWVTADGRLAAGTNQGFSFQTAKGWYNIKKDYWKIGINDHSTADWRYYVGDTLAYSLTNRIYTLLQRRNGDYFASLYGAYLWGAKGGGLLHFNLDDLQNYTVYDTTDAHLAGSAAHGGAANFLGIGYLALDDDENLWIANQYAQNDNVVAILTPAGEWYHFTIDDSRGYLNYFITAIAFDRQGRVWFGSEAVSGSTPSNGGIIILDYNHTLADKSDDKWYFVSTNNGLASNSVYSLAFDQEGELWIMSAGGIQRTQINNDLSVRIFYSIDEPYLSNLPFSKECRIRVDGLNNKWITTVDAGVKVYTYQGVWLNDVEGFTVENSDLLSNTVLDIAFYPPAGLVYLATSKGISVYKSPYAYFGKRYADFKVFPSPFRIPSSQPVVIDGLLQNSEVKIMLLDGTFIRHLTAAKGEVIGQQAFWDGRDYRGQLVSSGVYLFLAYTPTGDTKTGKLAVIRR